MLKKDYETNIEQLNLKIIKYNESVNYLSVKYTTISSTQEAKEFRSLENATLQLEEEITNEISGLHSVYEVKQWKTVKVTILTPSYYVKSPRTQYEVAFYKNKVFLRTTSVVVLILAICLFFSGFLAKQCDITSTSSMCEDYVLELQAIEQLSNEASDLGIETINITNSDDSNAEKIEQLETVIEDEYENTIEQLEVQARALGLDPVLIIGQETNIDKQIILLETAINEAYKVELEEVKNEAIKLGLNPTTIIGDETDVEQQIILVEGAIKEYYDTEITKLKDEATELGLKPETIIGSESDPAKQITLLEKAIKDEKAKVEAEKKEKETAKKEEEAKAEASSSSNSVTGNYTTTTVDTCSTSGTRQANVKVDIGYDSANINREYYAYTNSSAQLVYVTAEELIIQEDSEPMKGDGRYCNDEAKVPGTEDSDLDEGHVIADSLGGVSNAYNITPQESTLNRSGEQADMEEDLRTALENGRSVTNFYAEMTYPNTTSQIPSHYFYSYEIDGVYYEVEFDNDTSGTGSTSSSSGSTSSAPVETPEPVTPPVSSGSEPQFDTCSEREDNGYKDPIYEGDPEYGWYKDNDSDGIVCE